MTTETYLPTRPAPTNVVGEAIASTVRRAIATRRDTAVEAQINVGWGEVIGVVGGGVAGWLFARTFPQVAINLYGIGLGAGLGLVTARLIKTVAA